MKNTKIHWKKNKGQILLNFFFILIAIVYILPLLVVISTSFSSERSLVGAGFSIFPKEFSLDAYKLVFRNPTQILNSYRTTIVYCTINAFLSVIVMALTAYPLARDSFRMKRPITFFFLFTMLFNAGLVPTYMVNSKLLHLNNTMGIYIWPSLMSVYSMLIIRTNYRNVPKELIESAKIDGASEMYICFKIVVPLSKAAIASVLFLDFVGNWNNWVTSSIYIRKPELYSLQYLLQKILNESEFVKQQVEMGMLEENAIMPLETLRYAMAIVAGGPVLLIFPFFQKFFVKGITVGGVKE